MKQLLAVAIVGASLIMNVCAADETRTLAGEGDRISYSLGYQMGGDFKRQGVEVNREALIQGIRDAQSRAEPLMKPEEMQSTLVELKQRIVAANQTELQRKMEERKQQSLRIRNEGSEFLVANAKQEGVKTTESGLQYQVLREGSGKTPKATDTVTVNYRGTLIDGTEFDSSYRQDKPASFRVEEVIAGWREALQMMQEGDKWRLFIPSNLAYGERGPLADRVLVFEVELLTVN